MGVEKHFRDILDLVQKYGLKDVLSENTRVYSKLVEEFYLNDKHVDGEIMTKVKDITVTVDLVDMGIALGLFYEGLTGFEKNNKQKGLHFIGYEKKNPNIKGLKKKDFPKSFEFLIDIMGKYLLCKDSAHDSVNELQL